MPTIKKFAPLSLTLLLSFGAAAAAQETRAPTPTPNARRTVPISGGILNGKALNMPMPIYPDLARRSRIGGQVDVEVVIDITGKVVSAKAVKGPGMLHAAAEQAARYAKFSPTLLSGQPVRVSGTITYNFNLSQ